MNIALFLNQFETALLSPLQFFIRPDTRVFWPFLLGSIIVAALFLWAKKSNIYQLKNGFIAYVKQSSLYFDLLVWLTNQCWRVFLFLPLLIGQLTVTIWVVRNLYASFGDGPQWQMDVLWLSGLFALVSFLLDDFTRFYLHRFMHKNKWLWQFHQVHHSARVLSPFTLYRIHPVEMLLYMLRGTLVLGLCAGVFSYCFTGQITGWHILGVNAFGFIFNAALANLRHSPIRLGFGWFEHIFISPAQHQIHHQRSASDFQSNYGSCLALWDRCFGSLKLSAQTPERAIGLNFVEHRTLFSVWFTPFKHCWRLVKKI